MRNLILIYILFSIFQSVSAQEMELFGGVNSNHPYETVNEKNKPIWANFGSESSYTVGLSIGSLNLKGIVKRITLSHNKVKGYVSTWSSHFNASTYAQIEKHSINLTIYPLEYTFKNIYFSFGLQGNLMISRFSRGFAGMIGIEPAPSHLNIELTAPGFHKVFGYGMASRIHYNIEIQNGLSIVPQYNLYVGIGEEYTTAEYDKIRVWQQVFAIGIAKQF